MTNATHSLLLFAKYPYHGKVKTRLEPALGIDYAHQFAKIALIEILQYFGQLNGTSIDTNGSVCKCIWCYSPSEAGKDVQSLLRDLGLDHQWAVWPQLDTALSLGDRLSAAVAKASNETFQDPAISSGTNTCTFIGSDCFHLTTDLITKSMEAAGAKSARLLPATDGGYVLLSLPLPAKGAIFDNIRWSSRETANDQIIQMKRLGYSVEIGETLSDVDEPEDLKLLLEQCQGAGEAHLNLVFPQTIAFVQQHVKASLSDHDPASPSARLPPQLDPVPAVQP